MQESQLALLVPILVPLGAFLMVLGLRYLKNKENMSMIERGINPNEFKEQKQANPSYTLKSALMFIGAGLGLFLSLILNNTILSGSSDDTHAGVVFSLIAIFGGSGMLLAYLYERKNPPQ
jgi:hypothetical protein